jgi:hypothetical protein
MDDAEEPSRSSSDLPPAGNPAVPERDGALGAISGADGAALGTVQTQGLDPPHADADPSDRPVPRREEVPRDAERPWMTNLAGTGPDTGVQSDVEDPGAQEGHATPE